MGEPERPPSSLIFGAFNVTGSWAWQVPTSLGRIRPSPYDRIDKEQLRVTSNQRDTITNHVISPPMEPMVFVWPEVRNIRVEGPNSPNELLMPSIGAGHWTDGRQVVVVRVSAMDEGQPPATVK